MGRWSRCVLLAAASALCLLALPFLGSAQEPPVASRPHRSPVDLKREYQERRNRLKADDVQAHYELAEWCNQNQMYLQLLRQSQYVLQLQPDHENARLLYRLAVERLKAQNAQTRPGDADEAQTSDGEFLTPGAIQKLKWAEFLDAGQGLPRLPNAPRRYRNELQEEFLQVRFEGDVLNEFIDRMAGHPDFDSREERSLFLQLSPTLQTQLIRQHTGNRYQPRIEIRNNPLVFQQFEQVLPIITAGCAASRCHGGPDAHGWRLRTTRPRTDLNLYTNFLIVNRVTHGTQRLVNRPKPEESLLLQYGLPTQQAMYRHPQPIPPVYPRGFDDVRYRTVLAWIEGLTVPEPRPGVSLPGYPEPPPPQIGGKPKEAEAAVPAAQ